MTGCTLSVLESLQLAPEIRGVIERYEEEMKDPKMSEHLARMCRAQVRLLTEIVLKLEAAKG